MPARLLREGIVESSAVNALSFPAEVFYRRLMSVVDDFGRFDARPAVLRSRLYALKLDTVREADITRWIAECVNSGLVRLYEVDAKPYLTFLKLGPARSKTSKFPAPPDDGGRPFTPEGGCAQVKTDESSRAQVQTDESGCAQMRPYSGSGSYSGSGAEEEERQEPPQPPATGGRARRTAPAEHPLFPGFWDAYPRQVARADAARAFAKIGPGPDLLAAILAAVLAQQRPGGALEPRAAADGRSVVPYPATWLNGRRWEDRPPAAGPPPGVPPREQERLQLLTLVRTGTMRREEAEAQFKGPLE